MISRPWLIMTLALIVLATGISACMLSVRRKRRNDQENNAYSNIFGPIGMQLTQQPSGLFMIPRPSVCLLASRPERYFP